MSCVSDRGKWNTGQRTRSYATFLKYGKQKADRGNMATSSVLRWAVTGNRAAVSTPQLRNVVVGFSRSRRLTAYCDDIEPGGAMDTLGRTRVPKTGEIAPTLDREDRYSGAVGPTSLQSAVAVVCWGRIYGLGWLEKGLLNLRNSPKSGHNLGSTGT